MELDLKLVAETINCSDSVEFVDPEIMVDLVLVAETFDYSDSVEFVNPEIMLFNPSKFRRSNLPSSSDDRSPFFPSDSGTTKVSVFSSQSSTSGCDWSSTPVSSFIQIDAYTKAPVADLYNYHVSDNTLNVLTTKDILTYDIDIYLKFYKRSQPEVETFPSPTPMNNDDIPASSSLATTASSPAI
ncbi:unnamed protein product [Rhizophagus irregularis]|nr:unnamed protein product [Rhizophagus irregularis]